MVIFAYPFPGRHHAASPSVPRKDVRGRPKDADTSDENGQHAERKQLPYADLPPQEKNGFAHGILQ